MSSKIELVGLHNLVLDERLQPRAETDKEWCRELSALIKEGDSDIPAIDVFVIAGIYYVVSGFHRCGAAKSLARTEIKCNIHDGTWGDAVAFAAGSNKTPNGKKPMGPKDLRKAVRMLLDVPKWRLASLALIVEHVGCSETLARRMRIQYFADNNLEIPQEVVTRSGVIRPTRNTKRNDLKRTVSQTGHIHVGGKPTYVDRSRAGDRVDVTDPETTGLPRWRLSTIDAFALRMESLGFHVENVRVGHSASGVSGARCGDSVVVLLMSLDSQILRSKFFDVLAIKTTLGVDGRAIVVAYDIKESEITRVANTMGIEVLTPEEFVESLKTDASEAITS